MRDGRTDSDVTKIVGQLIAFFSSVAHAHLSLPSGNFRIWWKSDGIGRATDMEQISLSL